MLQINTFQYNPEDMACDQCAKYGGKERGCTAQACPWLAKRIEAGVVGYEEAVRETFDYRGADLFGQRATLLYDDFDQSDAAQVLAERRYELWLLEDMSLVVVSCVSVDFGTASSSPSTGRSSRATLEHSHVSEPGGAGREPV